MGSFHEYVRGPVLFPQRVARSLGESLGGRESVTMRRVGSQYMQWEPEEVWRGAPVGTQLSLWEPWNWDEGYGGPGLTAGMGGLKEETDLGLCPYNLRGTDGADPQGICFQLYRCEQVGEPLCQTDRPAEGWPSERPARRQALKWVEMISPEEARMVLGLLEKHADLAQLGQQLARNQYTPFQEKFDADMKRRA